LKWLGTRILNIYTVQDCELAVRAIKEEIGLNAILLVDERKRQIEVEGFNSKNDDNYTAEESPRAAACYCLSPMYKILKSNNPVDWPTWDLTWWKPAKDNSISERKRELIKAGALILAEMDRLDRLEE